MEPIRFQADFFTKYEMKFKALADKKRLQILHELCNRGTVCVCDLTDIIDMPQSKLSYHLKILLDAGMIKKETKGTWNYYQLHNEEISQILSEQLCCIFRPSHTVIASACSTQEKQVSESEQRVPDCCE